MFDYSSIAVLSMCKHPVSGLLGHHMWIYGVNTLDQTVSMCRMNPQKPKKRTNAALKGRFPVFSSYGQWTKSLLPPFFSCFLRRWTANLLPGALLEVQCSCYKYETLQVEEVFWLSYEQIPQDKIWFYKRTIIWVAWAKWSLNTVTPVSVISYWIVGYCSFFKFP